MQALPAEARLFPLPARRHAAARADPAPCAAPPAGNLQADIQAGAQTGFALLWWFALVSLICGTAFQCM